MKLICCHIENFGRLHQWDHDFTDGVHVLREDNGWGKSTLAAFLCVMFYGLSGDRKRKDPEANERRKYAPWQGGVFGGTLTFESEGKRYLLTRTFGRTSDKEDTCELRDARTNRLVDLGAVSPGEYFFHIGRDSFRGTVFLGQNNCRAAAGDDIHALIGNLSGEDGDLNRYEDAMSRLNRSMTALQAVRGGGGSMDRRKRQIEDLGRALREGSSLPDELERKESLLADEEARIRDLMARRKSAAELQARVSAAQEALARRENLLALQDAVEEKHHTLLQKRNHFPGEVPSLDRITEQLKVCSLMEQTAAQAASFHLSSEQLAVLTEGDRRFAEEVPSEEELQRLLRAEREATELRSRHASALLSPEEEQRYQELKGYYGSEADEAPAMMARWNERMAKESTLPGRIALLKREKDASASTRLSILTILGALLLAAGVYMSVFLRLLTGIIPIGGGMIVIVLSLLRRNSVHTPSAEEESMEAEIRSDEETVRQIDRDITVYLHRHGRNFDPEAVPALLQSIYEEYHEYASLAGRKERSRGLFSVTKAEALEREILEVLERYACPADGSLSDRLHGLRSDILQYRRLRAAHLQGEKLLAAKKDYEEKILAFLRSLQIPKTEDLQGQLLSIRDAADDYFDALRDSQAAETALNRFRETYDTEDIPTEDLPSLSDIARYIHRTDDDLAAGRVRISELRRRIGELRSACDDLEEQREEWEAAKVLQEEEQNRYRLLSRTRDALSQARDALTSRYADPVLAAFRSYVGDITGDPTDHYHLDADTTVTVDQMGLQRTVDAFSSGTRDLIGFALRIALVDAMYDGERPPLILDDPFVNLDDGKLASARELLSQIAERYQVIYFTCSDSRC